MRLCFSPFILLSIRSSTPWCAPCQIPAATPGAGSAGSPSWCARRAALSDQPCNPPDKLLNTSPLLLSSQCQWPGLQSQPRHSIILSYLLTVSPAVSTNLCHNGPSTQYNAKFCVEVFYALYINFHSFIHSFIHSHTLTSSNDCLP